jgi:hypothetical protein
VLALQALLAALMRSLGSLLNTAFGWATILLFGRVPQNRQIYLSVIAFGSMIWLVVVLGVAFPGAGVYLLTFVTLPKWVDRAWIRLAMLAGVSVLPLAVGAASMLMLDPEQRPKGAGARAALLLKGFPYTIGLALTLAMLLVFAPVLKVRNILRRWTESHIPVIVETRHYDGVVADVQAALHAGGVATERRGVSWMLRAPTSVLTWFAKDQTLVLRPEKLTTLVSPAIEVLLHPSDLVISGKDGDVSHARAIISERLTFTDAYLTWQKESNEMEDRLRAVWRSYRAGRLSEDDAAWELHLVERDLRTLKLPYDEWEVLFRELSMIKLRLLERCASREEAAWLPAMVPGKAAEWLLRLGTAVALLQDMRAQDGDVRPMRDDVPPNESRPERRAS